MAIMEQDVLMYDEDSSGNVSFQFPITRWGLVENSADVKTTPTSGDYIPVFDGVDGGKPKKVAWEAFNKLSTTIDEIFSIGDIRTTVASPSNKWLPCNGSGVLGANYPALVPLLGQNVKRWLVSGDGNARFYHVNGKLLLSGERSVWEYLPDSDEWVEHTNVTDYGSILCITYYNGKWIVAAGWLVMYVYTSSSLDGPWEKHGSYASSNTIYPISVIPKGDGGLIVAGYNISNYLGVGILTPDFQWSYTMFNETDEFGSCFIKNVNGYWIIAANFIDDVGGMPCVIYSQDPTAPASSWTKVQVLNTVHKITDIVYFNNTWTASVYLSSGYQKQGIRMVCSTSLNSGWTLKNIDTQAETPYVRQMCVDNGILYAVGWRDAPFVLRATSLSEWTYSKLCTSGNAPPCITVTNNEVFVRYGSDTDKYVAKIRDVTKDLLWDATLPNLPVDGALNYIKAL